MKMPSEDLFLLIKSLSSSEKRYFSVFANTYRKSESAYLKLFNAINELPVYDEKVLNDKLKLVGFGQNLKKAKSNLSEALEKCLVSYWNGTNIKISVRELLSYAEILYAKELYGNCIHVIDRGISISEKFELFNELRSFLQLKLIVIEAWGFKGISFEELKIIYLKLDDIQEKNLEINLYSKRAVDYNFKNFKQGQIWHKTLRPKGITKSKMVPSTYSGRLKYYSYLYAYFSTNKEHIQALSVVLKAQKLIELKPHMIDFNPKSYIICLTNIIHTFFALKRYERLPAYLDKLHKIKTNTLQTNNLKLYYYQSCLLSYHIETGNFDAGLRIFEIDILPSLKVYEAKPQQKKMIHFLASRLYFGKLNYSSALKNLSIVLNEKPDVRTDLHYYAKFFRLIIICEKRDFLILENSIKSVAYLIRSKNVFDKFDYLILTFITKLFIIWKKGLKNGEELRKLLKEAVELEKKGLSKAQSYFDFNSWMKAKVENYN